MESTDISAVASQAVAGRDDEIVRLHFDDLAKAFAVMGAQTLEGHRLGVAVVYIRQLDKRSAAPEGDGSHHAGETLIVVDVDFLADAEVAVDLVFAVSRIHRSVAISLAPMILANQLFAARTAAGPGCAAAPAGRNG